MNISSSLNALFSAATPPETAETPDAGMASKPSAPAQQGGNTVDAFDGGAALAPLAPGLPQLEVTGPTVSAATLMTQGSTALKLAPATRHGPEVLQEPISTETSPAMAPKDFTSVKLDVPWYSQHFDHGAVKGGNKSCNPMVKEMMTTGKNTATARGGDDASNFNVANSKDTVGRINPDPTRAAEAHAYIDAQLDAGKPVMVGVMWRTPNPGANGGNADHYVLITGRGIDAEGRAFYTFHDPGSKSPATGADSCPNNRFYVDEKTELLFRPGKQAARMYTSDARYEVSQVRKNQ